MKDIIKQLNLLISVGESNLAKVRQAIAILETLQLSEEAAVPQLPARRDPRYDLVMISDGWKLAPTDHLITKYDHFFCNGTWLPITHARVGARLMNHYVVTPDWNNPMDIKVISQDYRFLLKGEKRPQECFYYDSNNMVKRAASNGNLSTKHTYIVSVKHPLPSPNH